MINLLTQLIFFTLEEQQKYLLKEKLAFPVNNFPVETPGDLAVAKQKQRLLFDGKSNDRILSMFQNLAGCFQFAY